MDFKIPKEIIENIFNFIDIKSMFLMKTVCKLFNKTISEIINKNITYYFIFNLHKENTFKEFYMVLECDECKYIKNNYINNNKIYNRIVSMFNNECNKCKYKEIHSEPLYIKNLQIACVIPDIEYINYNELINNKKYLFNFYTNNKIINTKIFIINNEKSILILQEILNIILSESHGILEIYFSCNLNKEVYIYNNKLVKLILPQGLLKYRLELPNINSVQIYNCYEKSNFDDYKNFIDYIFNFSSKLKEITIENKALKYFNESIFQNKHINTLKIIIKSNRDNLFVNNLNILITNNNIKNIQLNHINKKIIQDLNNIQHIKKILVYNNI